MLHDGPAFDRLCRDVAASTPAVERGARASDTLNGRYLNLSPSIGGRVVEALADLRAYCGSFGIDFDIAVSLSSSVAALES